MVLITFKNQNDRYQWLSDGSFGVHQFRFRPGLCPGPRWGGDLQRSPDPLVGLRGPASKGEGRGKGRRREVGEAGPRFAHFLIHP